MEPGQVHGPDPQRPDCVGLEEDFTAFEGCLGSVQTILSSIREVYHREELGGLELLANKLPRLYGDVEPNYGRCRPIHRPMLAKGY